MFVNEKEKAKQYALRLLAARSYSSYQLRSKMLGRGYSEEIVSEWIEWLVRVELVKDDLVLVSLIEKEMRHGYGPRAISWKLRQKGFPLDVIARAIAEIAPMEAQRTAIAAWAGKKRGDVRKRASDLIRRGFDSDLVFDVLRESL